MKIVLTGTQSTGKTTVMDLFRDDYPELRRISEVARKIAKSGGKINEDGDDETQIKICEEYIRQFEIDDNWISDRGLSCVFGYTIYLYNHGKITRPVYEDLYITISQWIKNHPEIIYFLFPPTIPLQDDGLRSMDEQFRMEVHENILNVLKELESKFYIIETNNNEERINFIKEKIKENK